MLEVATRILADAGRALSARKILQLGERDDLFESAPSVKALREALVDAAEAGEGVRQVRRGVFALDDGPTPEPAVEQAPEHVAAAPAEQAEPDADAERASDSRKRRRRRPKPRDLAGDSPAAALTVEAAVAEAEAAEDAASLRASLWKKMRSRAAAAVGVDLDDAPEPEADAVVDDSSLRGRTASRLKARLRAEAAAWVEPPPPAPLVKLVAGERLVTDDPTADLKARLAARRQAAPLTAKAPAPAAPVPAPVEVAAVAKAEAPAPAAESAPAAAPEAPRRKRRRRRRTTPAEAAPPPAAQRASRAAPVELPRPERSVAPAAGAGLAERLHAALVDAGRPLDAQTLSDRVDAPVGAIRAALLASNTRSAAAGRRAAFELAHDGNLSLTEWALSRRYRLLEARIHDALAEQRSIVRAELIERVSELPDAGFERVIAMLLDGLAFEDVRVVHRQGGTVALVGRRDGEQTAVVAHRTLTEVGAATVEAIRQSLPGFEAVAGLILTTGGFADAARDAARRTEVRLVDGQALSRMLYDRGIGLVTHRPAMRHPDGAFFASLG